jgi:hypothetical protein
MILAASSVKDVVVDRSYNDDCVSGYIIYVRTLCTVNTCMMFF